jgi:hypothetical protein
MLCRQSSFARFFTTTLEPKKGKVIEVPFDSTAFKNGYATDLQNIGLNQCVH